MLLGWIKPAKTFTWNCSLTSVMSPTMNTSRLAFCRGFPSQCSWYTSLRLFRVLTVCQLPYKHPGISIHVIHVWFILLIIIITQCIILATCFFSHTGVSRILHKRVLVRLPGLSQRQLQSFMHWESVYWLLVRGWCWKEVNANQRQELEAAGHSCTCTYEGPLYM